jgi:hypothetical protein
MKNIHYVNIEFFSKINYYNFVTAQKLINTFSILNKIKI